MAKVVYLNNFNAVVNDVDAFLDDIDKVLTKHGDGTETYDIETEDAE